VLQCLHASPPVHLTRKIADFLRAEELSEPEELSRERTAPADLAGECDRQFVENCVNAALEAIQRLAVEAEFPILWQAEGLHESWDDLMRSVKADE
jgi:hypothetical protein